jgi:hypothetical protein
MSSLRLEQQRHACRLRRNLHFARALQQVVLRERVGDRSTADQQAVIAQDHDVAVCPGRPQAARDSSRSSVMPSKS